MTTILRGHVFHTPRSPFEAPDALGRSTTARWPSTTRA